MKKLLAILLAIALLATLTGCVQQPDADADSSAAESEVESSDMTEIDPTEGEDTTTSVEGEDTTTFEEDTTTFEEDTTSYEEDTTYYEEDTTSYEGESTTGTRGTFATGGIPEGLVTMKGTTTTFQKYEAATTKPTKATTTTTAKDPVKAEPVLNEEYHSYIYITDKDAEGNPVPALILASVKFTETTCVVSRYFYTGDANSPKIDNSREPIVNGDTTYYFTFHAAQEPARYEVVGITIDVFNSDGSIAKTFSMPSNDSMECSFSDGVAFGRQHTFQLEEK